MYRGDAGECSTGFLSGQSNEWRSKNGDTRLMAALAGCSENIIREVLKTDVKSIMNLSPPSLCPSGLRLEVGVSNRKELDTSLHTQRLALCTQSF